MFVGSAFRWFQKHLHAWMANFNNNHVFVYFIAEAVQLKFLDGT
jgi:hypothetical protein